jgi:hypothetical protein
MLELKCKNIWNYEEYKVLGRMPKGRAGHEKSWLMEGQIYIKGHNWEDCFVFTYILPIFSSTIFICHVYLMGKLEMFPFIWN